MSVEEALAYCRKYLPHQGRLADFIHHNTLHAFTDRPFDEALYEASVLYGNIPYPKIRDYHHWLDQGHIEKADVIKVIQEKVPGIFEREFRIGTAVLSGGELIEVLMSESAPYKLSFFEMYGRKFRAAEKVYRDWHRMLLKLSHEKKLDMGMPHLFKRTFFEKKTRIFHEALDETQGIMFRCLSAYFDQGVRKISLGFGEESLLIFFFTYFKKPLPLAHHWRKILSKNIGRYEHYSSSDILLEILTTLSLPKQEWKHYLFSLLYRFKGWSALILALEKKNSFQDFAALLLLCELSQIQDYYGSDDQKIKAVGEKLPLFHPVQKIYENNVRGIIRYLLNKKSLPRDLIHVSEEELLPLFEVCLVFHNFFKRELFQKAMDRKSQRDFLGAVGLRLQEPYVQMQPKFIGIFCIDEREESFRRHIEECEPQAETEGTAGHFGLNIEFKAYRRRHYRKLCPALETPFVRVREEAIESSSSLDRLFSIFGKSVVAIERAMLHPLWGMMVLLTLSPFLSLFLFVRIFFSHFYGRIKQKIVQRLFYDWKSRFVLESDDPNDQSRIVTSMAETLLTCGFKTIDAPYVFVVGHGSTSLNNPHEAAHDCGACAGGRGWPNSRLFSELANDPDVRNKLLSLGVRIHPQTYFIGAYHNTSSDDVEFLNLPNELNNDLKESMNIFLQAAKKNAQERNRRFLDQPLAKNKDQAKAYMVHRSLALDQLRPEYGHATNSYLVMGPRFLTRGLFMDRRSFLCSYEFKTDPEGYYLKNILKTVVPVCVGINLEYYFSWVDREGYGCDTKIPHNINGLNGVMNGFMSDLLLGLPLQMTEIHSPVRLKVLIFSPLDRVKSVLQSLPEISEEVQHEWFYLSVFDEYSQSFFSWSKGDFCKVDLPTIHLSYFKSSLEYIQGSRDFLDFALKG